MTHRWLVDPDLHPDVPKGDDYELQELEAKLKEDFGGDEWRVWHHKSSGVPGTGVGAGYTKNESGRYVLSALVLIGDAITTDIVRRVPVVALENSINISHDTVREEVDKLPPLQRTPDMSPEEFSRLVARHYLTWARGVPHPAAAMAADAGAKLPTVHTWIREARLRGFLPPAKRGKSSR
ncbi:CBS domain-containing protein [Nonomuraea muscovyensis]|uniref:CBS domain-containing protein n=1 Tax=Nonomuraea muscovyensis TaxID=1124761 RepID=A0A7X0BX70_9ACTN|nr:hypothetical protein [Nonomuraea muscovyensis]MBB6343786.1 CBS domain-containing protein [Nonomuraea muscovyensis]